jgi:hypothetical protein
MKKLAIMVLLGLAMLLANCGSRTVSQQNTTGAGGNWEAQLTGGIGQAALLNFVTNFNVGYGGGGLDITSFSFFNANSCFIAVGSENGSATLSTSGADQVTGSLTYTVTGSTGSSGGTSTLTLTANPSANEGELTGTASGSAGNTALQNGIAYGDWALTNNNNDSSCVGSGTFIMCQETATCTVTTGSN